MLTLISTTTIVYHCCTLLICNSLFFFRDAMWNPTDTSYLSVLLSMLRWAITTFMYICAMHDLKGWFRWCDFSKITLTCTCWLDKLYWLNETYFLMIVTSKSCTWVLSWCYTCWFSMLILHRCYTKQQYVTQDNSWCNIVNSGNNVLQHVAAMKFCIQVTLCTMLHHINF